MNLRVSPAHGRALKAIVRLLPLVASIALLACTPKAPEPPSLKSSLAFEIKTTEKAYVVGDNIDISIGFRNDSNNTVRVIMYGPNHAPTADEDAAWLWGSMGITAQDMCGRDLRLFGPPVISTVTAHIRSVRLRPGDHADVGHLNIGRVEIWAGEQWRRLNAEPGQYRVRANYGSTGADQYLYQLGPIDLSEVFRGEVTSNFVAVEIQGRQN